MTTPRPAWWANGELFENCNCTLVCPGHMHFSQHCTHEHCLGYWAIRIDDGAYGDVPLGGLRAVIAFDAAQRMIDGNPAADIASVRKVQQVFREGVGYDPAKLVASVSGKVGLW